jgi:hypothetical protein
MHAHFRTHLLSHWLTAGLHCAVEMGMKLAHCAWLVAGTVGIGVAIHAQLVIWECSRISLLSRRILLPWDLTSESALGVESGLCDRHPSLFRSVTVLNFYW